MHKGKKYVDSAKTIDRTKQYDPAEALSTVVSTAKAKFDETIELHVKLGVDSRHADQQVRGAIVLPHGTGKQVRVAVFAKGAKADEALAAGADIVGAEDLMERIQKENFFEFDVVIATPDMMGVVGRLGRVLGPKGLMPNPKAGTVSMDAVSYTHLDVYKRQRYRFCRRPLPEPISLFGVPPACRYAVYIRCSSSAMPSITP